MSGRRLRVQPPCPEWAQGHADAADAPVWTPNTHRGVKRAQVCGPAGDHSVLRALGTGGVGAYSGAALSVPATSSPSTTFCVVLHAHCAGDKPEVLRSHTRLLGQETSSNVHPAQLQNVVQGHTPQRSPGSHQSPDRDRAGVGLPTHQDAEGWGKEDPGGCWPGQWPLLLLDS